ncbi:MAG: bifunctional diguanylate cyclase/phosphodiesterase [Treponemataceae bacterium]|nr:bifunctional diguanylate cyclase/phosphodiesterase [Treponemataceae bacterium]
MNDVYGHKTGNKVLKNVAAYWSSLLNKDDILARIGGDEFCMILKASRYPNIENFLKNNVLNILLDGDMFGNSAENRRILASAGVVTFPEDGKNSDELLKHVDFAIYKAKKAGKGQYCFFDVNIKKQVLREVELEDCVKSGLTNNWFYMVYQPQFYIAQKKLRGFESLLRFKDANGKLISPADFIPIAEKHGMIFKIDYYVLNKVTTEFAPVVRKNPDLCVSVNISARHICDSYFVDEVERILKANNFPAECLELEITEYSYINSLDLAIKTLNQLKSMGIQLALDDFGTGYASLSILPKLPLDLIKIDKSLIDNIHTDDVARNFVEQIVNIGHSLGCNVIAEGIEAEEQAQVLSRQDCDYIQGYLWGKPMEYAQALTLIENNSV